MTLANMTLADKIAIGSGIAALAIALVIFFIRLGRVRAGADGQKKRVSKFLHRFASSRQAKVMDDVKLISGPLSGWANHILIGRFGALLVYDLSIQGEYYGKPEDERWTVSASEGKRWAVENPLFEADRCEGRVKTLLKDRAGIRISVEKAVVIACPLRGAASYIPSEKVILYKNLRSYLEQSKFQQDNGIDPEQVYKILSEAKS